MQGDPYHPEKAKRWTVLESLPKEGAFIDILSKTSWKLFGFLASRAIDTSCAICYSSSRELKQSLDHPRNWWYESRGACHSKNISTYLTEVGHVIKTNSIIISWLDNLACLTSLLSIPSFFPPPIPPFLSPFPFHSSFPFFPLPSPLSLFLPHLCLTGSMLAETCSYLLL